ncbi:LLM class flavin-dependent oxidoreductase [Roseateles amylovorans]|uniref:LLM class flavin-dependent oxidoreductase n=1 Tax=Roseateles amylovorans TaxID=2978473 RepID=A0ABY6B739_9BURK|nr:LLM class flavin-dependent oxidoreductase [Roseateles amylovorans]UXH80864.1 LLM class flavin-dependent oxidoreductase [Roseateles amylovorans]
MTRLSVLDLAFIVEGGDAAQALRGSIALAQHAERLGYERFWVAEHHNMEGVASSATAVLIGQIAAATQTIRVGSGGIMLPNHAPLTIAEQFGTLATFFPGRIDLGLGRAPGTDGPTMRALRRHLATAHEDRFPEDVLELQAYLAPAKKDQVVRAVPGQGTEVPIWLLGSSLYSAQLSAYLGLPFAFASHFAPAMLMQALEIYRAQYRPSERHPRPYAAVALNVIVADTDAEAIRLFSSIQQRFLGMQRGERGLLPRPVDSIDALWTAGEKLAVERMLSESIVGSPRTVRARLEETLARTEADELIVACAVHDAAARRRSYELLAGLNR